MKVRIIPSLVVSLVLMPIIAVLVLSFRGSFRIRDLKIFGQIPAFSLTERGGEKKNLESLRSKVWILNFICSSCDNLSPLIMLEAQKISKALLFKENFRVVSVSSDPAKDSPQKLSEFASGWKADPFKWWFLTGTSPEFDHFIQSQPKFREKFILVDHLARIRGYYEAQDGRQMKQLLKDSKKLIKQAF